MALALIFITAQILIILFAGSALEGVNALRAYATGEAQWSKAQKRAVIGLMHYAGSRDARDLVEFHHAMQVIEGDTRARLALEKSPPDMRTARDGFLAGLNDDADVWGLSWGFLLLHRWAPFALAVEDWRGADALTARLSYLSGQLRGAVEGDAPLSRLREILAEISALDRGFSIAEYKFSVHMGEASRSAKSTTLLLMEIACLFVSLLVGILVRHIAEASTRAEAQARDDATRVRDYVELASDWFCELDRDLAVRNMSPRFLRVANVELEDLAGHPWLSLDDGLGLHPMSEIHGAAISRRAPFRDHQFRQDTGGPVFYWSVSGKPVYDVEGAFDGYRITASEITRYMRAIEDLSRAQDEVPVPSSRQVA